MSANAAASATPAGPGRKGRILAGIGMFLLVWAVAYFSGMQELVEDIEQREMQEARLKDDYRAKKAQAVNLDLLRQQLREVDATVDVLKVVLPARIDKQFIELMQLAQANGLRIDRLDLPANDQVREGFAELSGTLRVSGPFHGIGAFVGELGASNAIVVLQDLKVESVPGRDSVAMDATVKAYRYLDEEELVAARKAARKAVSKK